jgi:hypothetical protein
VTNERKTRRTFTERQRAEVLRTLRAAPYGQKKVVLKRLGISEGLAYNWQKRAGLVSAPSTPSAPRAQQQRIEHRKYARRSSSAAPDAALELEVLRSLLRLAVSRGFLGELRLGDNVQR